jgi:glycerate kinase
MNVPCVALVGSAGEGAEAALGEGLTAYHPINDGSLSVEQSMARAAELLDRCASRVVGDFARGA